MKKEWALITARTQSGFNYLKTLFESYYTKINIILITILVLASKRVLYSNRSVTKTKLQLNNRSFKNQHHLLATTTSLFAFPPYNLDDKISQVPRIFFYRYRPYYIKLRSIVDCFIPFEKFASARSGSNPAVYINSMCLNGKLHNLVLVLNNICIWLTDAQFSALFLYM